MTKFRKKTEIIEAVKWDGRLETIETNIWLEDSIKEDRVILGMNDIHDKEPILILLFDDNRNGYTVEVGEYIVKRNIKEGYIIEAIPSEYFEKEYEEIKENKSDSFVINLELNTDDFEKQLQEAKEKIDKISNINNKIQCENGFQVITKDMFKIKCIGSLMNKKEVDEKWNEISKGYNFVLYKHINGNAFYYSVELMDDMLGE